MKQNIRKDSYSLTPLQQGMLYHALSHAQSGVDIEQFVLKIHEPLRLELFNQALHTLATRYTVFRTRFTWEGLEKPLQIVDSEPALVTRVHNWKHYSLEEREDVLSQFLAEDRRTGFDVTRAPLMRMNLCEVSESEYYVLWTFHHILLDGRSIFIILKELFALYDALAAGTDIEMTPITPFSTYTGWIAEQDFSSHRSYWQKQLAGFTSPVLLPETIETSPGVETYLEQRIHLPETLTSALYTFAETQQVTLHTLLQGAWALLLYRYTNQTDIVFGSVRACRHTPIKNCNNIVGLLINTLPIRITINSDKTLCAWLREIREQQLAQRAYEHTPLSEITKWSDCSSQTQLLTTLLVFENYHLHDQLQSLGEKWQHRTLEYHEQTNFPLTIAAHGGSRLLIRVEYQADSYDSRVIRNILENMRTILESMLEHAQSLLLEIPYLSAKECATLQEWNQTGKALPENICAHTFFEEQAHKTPHKNALYHNKKIFTYQELDRKANQLAHAILSRGILQGSIIAIVMERSLEIITSMFAVLKAGCAFLPIDNTLPAERIKFMLNDSQVPCVLTRQHLAAHIPTGYEVITCDEETTFSRMPVTPPEIEGTPENLAYIIYTSGSTGQPKGVMIQHKALINLCFWYNEAYEISINDNTTQYAHIGFDASLFEIFPCLMKGATLHIIDEELKLDIEALHAYYETHNITISFLPTKICEEFMKHPNASLKKLTTGGDSLSHYTKQEYEIYNNYGPTENCIITTCHRVDDRYSRIPIGKPIANNKIFILNRQQQLTPIGAPGELCVSGAGLARGYLQRETLTAEKFVLNPYLPGEKMYKTGDLARWLPDGTIDFLGRLDHQVKVRGYRIELGEIEALLASHTHLQHAVVVTHKPTPQITRLVAYIVAHGQHLPSTEELRDFLKQQLPAYMIPDFFVPLEALPLTHNGKVDRKRLPEPKTDRLSRISSYLQPQTDAEKSIAEIWQNILHIQNVGITENFFDIGGNSLFLVQVAGFIRKKFNTQLEIFRLFEYPTIKSLAAYLTSEQEQESPTDAIEKRTQKKKAALARKRNKKMKTRKQDEQHGAL